MRAALLPDVQTVAEAGYPGAQYLFWGGLAFPAGTPRAIVDRLHDETRKALSLPAVQERLAIVIDPANLFEQADARERRRLVEEATALLGPELAMAHAKDRAADGSFTAPGRGVIDFAHFVRTLGAAGFDGPLVTHGLTAAEAPEVARLLGGLLA